MPEICRFFGIVIKMYFDDHDPAYSYAAYWYELAPGSRADKVGHTANAVRHALVDRAGLSA
jgi:hypothetical protein